MSRVWTACHSWFVKYYEGATMVEDAASEEHIARLEGELRELSTRKRRRHSDSTVTPAQGRAG